MSLKISFIVIAVIFCASCQNVEKAFNGKQKNKLENSDRSVSDPSEDESEKKLDAIQQKLNSIDTKIEIEVETPSEDKSGFRDGAPTEIDEDSDEDEVALRVDEETKEFVDKANKFAETIEAGPLKK